MKILAFLQNQWFRDPARMQRILQKHYAGRREDFNRTFLFWQGMRGMCTTGRRLQAAFGEDLCREIIWEEASPVIAGKASACPPADVTHIGTTIADHRPDIILVFGSVAERGIRTLAPNLDGCTHIIFGRHPAARGAATIPALQHMAADLQKEIRRQEALR